MQEVGEDEQAFLTLFSTLIIKELFHKADS